MTPEQAAVIIQRAWINYVDRRMAGCYEGITFDDMYPDMGSDLIVIEP